MLLLKFNTLNISILKKYLLGFIILLKKLLVADFII